MAQRRKWNKTLVIQEIKLLNFKLGRKPSKRDSSNLYSLTRQYFGSWNNALNRAGFKVNFLQVPSIPQKLNEDLAYLIGLIITDGHIVYEDTPGRYKVLIYSSYPEEKELIIALIQKLFKYSPGVSIRKNIGFSKKPNYEVRISSKNVAEFFINKIKIPSGAKSKIVRVPPYLFVMDKKIISSFVRGIIDGDGSIAKSHVKIASGSIKFLEDFKRLLNRININSGNITSEKNSGTFILYLSSKDNLSRLYHLLYDSHGYSYPRKKRSWEDLKNRCES